LISSFAGVISGKIEKARQIQRNQRKGEKGINKVLSLPAISTGSMVGATLRTAVLDGIYSQDLLLNHNRKRLGARFLAVPRESKYETKWVWR
jgi:hypothetical protein